jgi:hypothetical protein
MTLLRVLHAEMLKMKRTIALKMVVLCPAVIVLLMFFVSSQAPFSTLNRNGISNEWTTLARSNLRFWAFLMMPLYIALQTALLAGLDHSENQWKSLLARPVPRWTFYVAKLLVAVAMTAASTLTLLCGIVIAGSILPRVQSQLVFGFPIPWAAIFRDGSQIAGLGFLALTIQHWVSLRWRSFSVAVGAGIMATVVGIFAVAAGQQVGGWPQYFPWSLPMLVLARQPHDIGAILLISGALGLVVAGVGCVDFCRREVT